MFYRTDDREPRHGGLPHNPLNAIVAPRPIGWISTRASHGDNLAPYSYFNAVSSDPPQVMFAGDRKDSLRNIEETGVFAVNLVDSFISELDPRQFDRLVWSPDMIGCASFKPR